MQRGTLRVSGGSLETAWWGPGSAEAPTLVLLHEGLGCVDLWRDVPERLAASTGWGVFAYSRFGYGRSDTAVLPRPVTYMHTEALDVLPEVLSTAGIGRHVLVGHSDGGSISAIFAGSVGDPATAFVSSADTAPVVPSPGMAPAVSWPGLARPSTTCGAESTKGVDGSVKPGHDTSGLIGLVTLAAHFFVEDLNIASIERIKIEYKTGKLRDRLARYHRDVDAAFWGWNGAWLNPDFRRFDITGFLPGIDVPILALQGSDDPYGTDEQLRVFESHVHAPITVQLIPGAKHSPHLEAKDATLAAITRFITELPI
jgi:pimeloyl-ACP methyl ester carboxylesterase